MSLRANPRAPTKPLDKVQRLETALNEVFGEKKADISVWVDLVTLIRIMGSRAVKNKAHRAQLLGGAIVVKATNVKDHGSAHRSSMSLETPLDDGRNARDPCIES